jgi:hypothetical protein
MKVSVGRFIVGVFVIAGFCSLAFWLHTLTDNPLFLCVLAICYIVPQSAFWEWAIHGFVYHRKFIGGEKIREIHSAHHWAIFPPTRYVHEGPHAHMRMRGPLRPYRMADNWLDSAHASGGQILFHFAAGLPFIIIPTYYAVGSSFFMAAVLTVHCILSVLFAYVHGCIHTPKNRLVERTRWFKFLDKHHYVHHIDTSVNVNFLLPIGDWVFGTLRLLKDLTPEELSRYPTFELAKQVDNENTTTSLAVGS